MFARKKKSHLFNETLSPEMLNRPKMPENANRTYFLKREKHNLINGTSCYFSETASRLNKGSNKFRSKSRSALDEEDEDGYLGEREEEKISDKLKLKASRLRKKLLNLSKSQLYEESSNNDELMSNIKINFSNEQLDLVDSNDQNDKNDSNIKSNSSKSTLFVKFFQKSESQPVTRKNSENEVCQFFFIQF